MSDREWGSKTPSTLIKAIISFLTIGMSYGIVIAEWISDDSAN